jgi:tripeptidyl-peptidase-1
MVVHGGQVAPVGGTSASTPAFAAMVSLLNEARVQKGRPPLGFLNPMLYSLQAQGEGFTDITVGNNAISRSGGAVKYGYPCTEGWDPVTGLGTPRFDNLLEHTVDY